MKIWLSGPWGLITFVAVAVIITGWSAVRLSDARSESHNAATLLEQAVGYAQVIQQHQTLPNQVSDREIELTLIAQLIEHAADEAHINRQALDRVWPQPARRVGDTPYQSKATQVVVRDVTLPQAVTFLHTLASTKPALRLDALRLSAPRNPRTPGTRQPPEVGSSVIAAEETWNLEATVSQLIYQPVTTNTPLANRD